jgi:hypothetical protein
MENPFQRQPRHYLNDTVYSFTPLGYIMYTLKSWPQRHTLPVCEEAYRLLIDTITTPFDSTAAAKEFWNDTQCQLYLYHDDNPTVLTHAQWLCMNEPEFIEHNHASSLYCRIVGDAGGGDFLLIIHS